MEQRTDWNSFARLNASERWRRQSATMGTPLTELIVREAHVQPGMRVLDVACGTGEPAISIAAQLNGTGEVVATDISPDPLKVGEGRARQRGLTNITFRVADAHQLPFGDAEFDRITSRLGLMFFADLPKALREIRRVLKPGGQFTAVCWGPMQQPYFETTIGTVLRMLPQSQLPTTAEAMFKFGRTGSLSTALSEAGFSEAHDELREVEWSWPGPPDDVWAYFQQVTIPFSPLLKSIPEEHRVGINRAVVDTIGRYYGGEHVRFGAAISLGIGIR